MHVAVDRDCMATGWYILYTASLLFIIMIRIVIDSMYVPSERSPN